MIDLKHFREKPELYRKACKDKRIKFDVDNFLSLDSKYREIKVVTEKIRSEQNELSRQVPLLKGEEQKVVRDKLKDLSIAVKEKNTELAALEVEWQRLQLLIPSVPLSQVPVGKDDSENVEVKKWGEPFKPKFKLKDHVELGAALELFDLERGAKVAGARNYFLIGDGAKLHHAVMNLALDLISSRGYKIMDTPHIVNYEAMTGTGYFPGGEDMAFHLDARDDRSYLIGTSEVALVSFHQGESFKDEDLPKKYAGYSPCYRREAGSYGKDTQGLYRVHQFFKVEQVVICRPDANLSAELHKELLGNAETLLQMLELPYRVVEVCTGDMGQGQVFKHDIETWMPSRSGYGETHSCSTLYDFQARRSEIRYKGDLAEGRFCHTLNNTLVASPRVLIPLIENHQQEDGSIKIPKALVPYFGGREFIR